MATHSALTGAELHEPKGIENAEEGMIYLADGAGSGSWTYSPLGWGYYQDAGAAQVIGTTAAKISIDGAGSLTQEAYLPPEIRGTGSLWDTTNDKIMPIRTGDAYDVRVDLPITAESGSPTELTLQFDIGGAATPTIVILQRYITTGKSTPYTMSVGFPILSLTDTTTTNGVQIFAVTDTGTVTITNPSITLVKNTDGSF